MRAVDDNCDNQFGSKLVKVAVLGAPGVGKTALVQRLVSHSFSRACRPTSSKSDFFPSLLLNERIFELKLTDLPPIPFFPTNNDQEWEHYRSFGLRSASAYVLVYDASRPASSFAHIRMLREQILSSRDMANVPVIVVANKLDLVQHQQSNGNTNQQSDHNWRERQEVVHIVRKYWRTSHVDCSTRFNFNVLSVFRELAIGLDSAENNFEANESSQQNGQVRRKKCLGF